MYHIVLWIVYNVSVLHYILQYTGSFFAASSDSGGGGGFGGGGDQSFSADR